MSSGINIEILESS